jgi:hypothetical protein
LQDRCCLSCNSGQAFDRDQLSNFFAITEVCELSDNIDGTRPGYDVADPIRQNVKRENGGNARAVADGLARTFRSQPQHLNAKIFLGIFEIEFLGNRHAIVANNGTPQDFWVSTDFDFCPSVTRTASASWTTCQLSPRNARCIAKTFAEEIALPQRNILEETSVSVARFEKRSNYEQEC